MSCTASGTTAYNTQTDLQMQTRAEPENPKCSRAELQTGHVQARKENAAQEKQQMNSDSSISYERKSRCLLYVESNRRSPVGTIPRGQFLASVQGELLDSLPC